MQIFQFDPRLSEWRGVATDQNPTREDMADALRKVFGRHVNMRASHAKGIFAQGSFSAAPRMPRQSGHSIDGWKRVLFGTDVWEHAYYVSYQNRRADYLIALRTAINGDVVAHRYANAKTRTAPDPTVLWLRQLVRSF